MPDIIREDDVDGAFALHGIAEALVTLVRGGAVGPGAPRIATP
jgi:hypothetical protein